MSAQFEGKIQLVAGLGFEAKSTAIEFARAKGFSCEAAVFPVTSWVEGMQIPTSIEEIGETAPEAVREAESIPEGYVASSDSALPMPEYDLRQHKGLEKIFSKGVFLKDENLDELPDAMDVHIVLPSESGDSQFAAAMNVAFRLGMETTAYEGTLLRAESAAGNEIIFEGGDAFAITYEETAEGVKVRVTGDGEELEAGMAEFCENFPLQGDYDTWTTRLCEMIVGFGMNTLDGQLARLEAMGEQRAETAYVDSVIDQLPAECREAIEKRFPETSFVSYKSDRLVYEKEYDITWEVDDMEQVLENKIYPNLKAGQDVRIEIAVSEDKEVRAEIEEKIGAKMQEMDLSATVQVLCSYKQGFSWIDERINPELAALGNVEKVRIEFKPFLPEGETVWKDEDGATPHYNNVQNDPDRWYDLPIRYLQELYPIEDAIVAAVGVDKDNVEFAAYEGSENLTYLVTAYDAAGELVYSNEYLATNSERPYLDAFPNLGKVHPATGYVRVWVNDELLANERICSDVEKIWELYQTDVLPMARTYAEQVAEGKDLVEAQPFFSTLQLDIVASEPNEVLNSREDLFSTLDALHEDIYFAGTDYFKNFGLEKVGAITDAPGLILPVIKKGKGKPYFKVSLFGQQKSCPTLQLGDQEIVSPLAKWDVDLWMQKYEKKEGKTVVTLKLAGIDEAYAAAFAKLLDEGTMELSHKIYGVDEVVFETAAGSYKAAVKAPAPVEKNVDIRDMDLMERTLIGYDDCMKLIDQLKHVEGLKVFRTTLSYMGRSIYAVEFAPHLEGYVSRIKRITFHPTEIINTRHHANEVAGTNSAFRMIRKILTEEKFKNLPDDMNLIFVPMENADGAAIHYELQKDNPTWKLHIARFNAVGKEFYYDHFVDETMHREAKGLKRLFMDKLPDFLIDNHGVPSHEWEQQFAGYTSPSYRGFWLPRSLIYGYFYHIAGEKYESNITLNKAMEDVIADAFLANEAITEVNLSWARQFERYAHAWMPRLFPANYYKNMINYWIPSAYTPDHRYPSIKYPWILSVDYVSEVADETAQGDYLYDCANAHVVHDEAILDMIVSCKYVYKKEWKYSEDGIKAEMTRKRPIIFK